MPLFSRRLQKDLSDSNYLSPKTRSQFWQGFTTIFGQKTTAKIIQAWDRMAYNLRGSRAFLRNLRCF